jgi:DeoR/GlpR family transcriptional regulator of sugar metabolism
MLDVNHSTTINQLAEYFTVSHMTIRRDVEELQKNGQVKLYSVDKLLRDSLTKVRNIKIKRSTILHGRKR